MEIKIKRLVEELPSGYRPFTTFYQDLSIAGHFGPQAVKETYHRGIHDWMGDYK